MPKPKAGRASRIRLPLKLKLSLLITALLVVTVTFLSAFLLYRAERSLIAQMTKRGLTIAQHLANGAMNAADVAYAIVTDHDGKIVAHPDVTLIGRPLERPTGLARLGDDLLIQTYTDSDNERIMDFAIPLTFRKVPVGAVFLGFSQKSIEQALDKARNQTIGISVVMVLIGIGGALGLAGRIARPILRLVEGTRAIAQGDFGVTLAVPSRDEIGDLTEAFNLMANNLREKEMIKRAFARYVDREVVDELLKDPENLVLSGERRAVTVLFCDLRSLTALSERLTPEEVVMLLNDFYNLMIEATFQNAGTLDKFLGDAVMSIFGAPIAHPDHAMRAVRTAVAMRDGIEGLSARRIRDGKDPLTVGIGVSTGDAVAGTVGTEDRMEYTVIGDSVNLAARLESNAKSMQILISGRTYRDVKEHVQARPLGEVKVKGKEEAVEIYEVLRLK